MNITDLVDELSNHDIVIGLKGDQLELSFKGDALDPEIIEKIRAHKTELISYLRKYVKNSHAFQEIRRLNPAASYPVSDAQRRLWVLSQFDDGLLAYNLPSKLDLSGAYDIENFQKAIYAIIERHEILRTVFREDEQGELRQWVLSPEALGFEVGYQDYRDQIDRHEQVQAFVDQDAFQPFDLSQGPLIRARLMQVEDEEFVFYCNMHHIVSDGWSMKIIVRDVMAYYEAFRQHQPLNLPSLRVQYKDYASWQLAQLKDDAYTTHQAYWLKQLSGELPLVDLPNQKNRPKIKTNNGKTLETFLPKELSLQLHKLAKDTESSLFITLLSIWNLLIHKYTHQKDIIFASPIAGRNHPDLEDQIGFYVNTLALRNHVDEQQTFAELVQSVKVTTLEAFDHQQYPFDRLVNELGLARDTSRSAITDIMVILQNAGEDVTEFEVGEQEIGQIKDLGQQMSRFDLEITHEALGDYIGLKVNYNTDIYEQSTVEQLMRHFQLLAAAVPNSTEVVGAIDYLSETEKSVLLHTFNNTHTDYQDKLVVELFEDQVLRVPESVAVSSSEGQLTYVELNKRANQLAHFLKARLAEQPKQNVGVMLSRSIDSVLAMIAVAKAGACYVPIDHLYPTSRVNFILEDSEISILITHQAMMHDHDLSALTTIDLDAFDFAAHAHHNPPVINLASDDSFVVYTSGSTGRPKGVRQTHRLLTNMIQWDVLDAGLAVGERSLQYSSFNFDMSVFDVYFNLCCGGELYITNEDERSDYDLLRTLIIEGKFKNLTFPYAAMNNFFNQVRLEELSGHSIAHIMAAGEQLYVNDTLDQFLEQNPEVKLHNHYGPSETHVVTAHTISYAQGNMEKRVPIGKPIANTQVYLLDSFLKPVPVGAKGELYIGGDNLANGYINLPDSTQEKFVPSPFTEGALLYKSGDLGFWRSDGVIEYIGRKDDQIKIRGYRVELGEIEYALLQYEAIENAVVLARNQNLVAFFTSEQPLDYSDIQQYLKGQLPQYMLPHSYVQVDTFELTINGKIDKRALAAYEVEVFSSSAAYVAPETDTERGISDIWTHILRKERIGVHDDFFELGGHSLNATKLISEYHKHFSVRLRLPDIFAQPTLAGQAELIEQATLESFEEIPLAPEAESYPLSDAQHMIWLKSQFEEGSLSYVMPTVREIKGDYDLETLKQALRALMDRHEILRTVFRKDASGQPRQFILDGASLPFEFQYHDIQGQADPDAFIDKYVFEEDYIKPFDFENGPMFRAGFFRKGEGQLVFFFTFHHIITDAWSVNIMTRDLMQLYQQIKTGEPANLPDLRIQYKDYASWQQNVLFNNENQQHEAFWVSRLKDEPSRITMPFQKSRPKVKTFNGRYLSTYLSSSLTSAFDTFSQDHKGSSYMTLLAIWNVLIYRYTALKDITVASPIAGREHSDLHDQIGCFINTLVMRNTLDPSLTFLEFYQQIIDTTVDTYAHQRYPFERLIEKLDHKADLSRNPVFDIMLADQKVGHMYEEGIFEEFTLADDEVDRFEDLGMRYAKFDLEFHFYRVAPFTNFRMKYNEDLFDRQDIERLVRHFKHLAESLLNDPNQKISEVQYLPAAEEEQILKRFSYNNLSEKLEVSMTDLFREQVNQRPGQTALVFGHQSYTYQELDGLTNRFGRYLQETFEIRTGDLVCIRLPRSEWSVIAMLSILKIGATYVPIDVDYPEMRIDFIIQDSNSSGVITQDEIADFEVQQAEWSPAPIEVVVSREDIAYVTYTSGSTGNPKGVLVPHRGVVRLSQMQVLTLDQQTAVLHLSSVAFDSTTFEVWCPLLNGGRVIIYNQKYVDFTSINQHITDHAVNTIWLTSALFDKWVDTDIARLPLKYVLAGGDVVKPTSVEKAYERLPEVSVINGYGPTENTTFTTVHLIPKTHDFNTSIPIGRPLEHTQLYILDEEGNPCPIGVVGELCVSGAGLSKGYLNLDELTKDKFIANPFSQSADDQLLYKTGDLTRWAPDGTVIFVGRKDNQVKIRGNRIELGEVERAIYSYHPSMRQVAVLATEQQGEKLLAAYFVAEMNTDKADLKRYLNQLLPDYMIPTYFVALDSIPVTSNGKIDQDSLPAIQASDIIQRAYVAPANALEETIVKLWQGLLGIEEISVEDNFFDVGGNSIRATQLFEGLAKLTEQPLKIAGLFQHATIREQAVWIASQELQEEEEELLVNEIEF